MSKMTKIQNKILFVSEEPNKNQGQLSGGVIARQIQHCSTIFVAFFRVVIFAPIWYQTETNGAVLGT